MTDREIVAILLNRLNPELNGVLYEDNTYIELQNYCVGENICFTFDNNGNILTIEC